MKYDKKNRIVLTLDAGGTNFVFSAIKGNSEIIEPIILPSKPDNLRACLDTITDGLTQCREKLVNEPAAISLAFPGPADYPNGIIGDLHNLPAFRGGVALGAFLEEKFKIPVFINNDGNLFVFGEAIAGLLPSINNLLAKADNPKRFNNLFGITLGTGLGGGIVTNGNLLIGDNSASGEIWKIRHKLDRDNIVEEGASIRAIKKFYSKLAGIDLKKCPEPEQIYQIGTGEYQGNKAAAIETFRKMGEIVGDALANAITLIDGLVVIGGGLSAAHKLFLPEIIKEMNGSIGNVSRLEVKAFNLEDPGELSTFVKGEQKEILIPDTNKRISYDPIQRIGIGISKLGTAKAVGIGAYAFAINALDKQQHFVKVSNFPKP